MKHSRVYMSSGADYTTIPDYDDGDKLARVYSDDVDVEYGVPEPHFRGSRWYERHQAIIMPEAHTRCELLWNDPADGTLQSQYIIEGQACFIEKGIVHALRWDVRAPLICLCIAENYFQHFSKKIKRCGVFVRRWYEIAGDDVLMKELVERIYEISNQSVFPALGYPRGLAAALAAQLLGCPNFCRTTAAIKDGLAPFHLNKVLAYIEEHLSESIKVEKLAKVVGLSKSNFSQLFTVSTGLPPHRYIVRERLKQAKALLRKGEMKIAAIAAETGFCDQSHLSRSMKRHMDVQTSQSINIQNQDTNIQSKPNETGHTGGTL